VARLSRAGEALRRREILAPVLAGGAVRTRLDGLVHTFRLRGAFAGWGRFRPISEREAELAGEAEPWERAAYLDLLPALRVILLWPDPDARRPGAWWAIPFNESDARQRFGLGAEPLPVYLCDPTLGAERFERAVARVDGRTLWYDSLDTLADPTQADWLREAAAETIPERFPAGLAASQRQALLLAHLRSLEQNVAGGQAPGGNHREQEAWLRRRAQADRLEDRLRYSLARADATLHSYQVLPGRDSVPEALVVEWTARGQSYRYRSTLDPDLSVISSGICLSGRDRDFDLTSLVNVMEGA
jgi:hypothetical protein